MPINHEDLAIVTLSQDEADFVRLLLREDTDHDPDVLLDEQSLTVTWSQARDIGKTTVAHMMNATADAHQRGVRGDLDYQFKTVQSVNQKLLGAFKETTYE